MRRVSLVGNSGSGKSTFGRVLAQRLGVPFVELDSIFHQAGWSPLPLEDFRARIAQVVAGDGWVVDGNYSAVRDLIVARADTTVFFDLPRWRVMTQLTRRTLTRMARREVLWNGNREQWRNLFSRDPELNILLWAWTQHAKYRRRYDAEDGHLVRITSRTDAAALLLALDD